MKVRGFRVVVLLMSMCAPGLAHAYCSEPLRYSFTSFEDQVSGYFDYLLCLHNEQVGSLNEHARLINQLADEIDALPDGASAADENAYSLIIREVVVKYSAVQAENERLRQLVSDLEARVVNLERQAAAN